MICTEEEAKEKWCPMGRTSDVKQNAGFNRWSNERTRQTIPITMCIASECMWWVQVVETTITGKALRSPTPGRCGLIHR